MTYLTVPIAAKNLEAARGLVEAAVAGGAQMLELRTDYLDNVSPVLVKSLIAETRGAAGESRLPITVTCRDKRQGGARAYPLKLRIEVLTSALGCGAEFIDFEYENFLPAENRGKLLRALSQNSKARLILSAHNFQTRFANIGKLYRDILALYPAAIPKLVYTAKHIDDCFEAFDLLRGTGGERIVFCMGEAGIISRIIAKKLGSFVTFASIDQGRATAPGQVTIRQFKDIYRYDAINTETGLYGVIGSPIAHSLSPPVHNMGFADAKVNKLYLPLLVEGGSNDFERFMQNILRRQWLGFAGFSVTIPHKRNALDYVKANRGYVEPLAERVGAANTLLVGADGQLSAYNTDCAGALDAITSTLGISGAELKNLPVVVIGAGGVARAIVAGLTDVGAEVKIYNRTFEKGEKLAAEFGCYFAPLRELPGLKAKLVINCTSIGMHPNVDETPLPKECITKGMVVFDTVYNPFETLLLKQARERRAKRIDGLMMFVNQACAQFNLFTGRKANRELMWRSVCESLRGK